jgi:arginyl-tRNA synthetase
MRKEIDEVIRKAIGVELPVEIDVPENEKFGDYSTNVAFIMAKTEKKPPRAVAEELAPKIAAGCAEWFEAVTVAGGGFINLKVKKEKLLAGMADILDDPENWGRNEVGKGKTAIVEYFQLNVAKIPHVGHLRSAVVGDALKRVLIASGYKTVSDTHVGDWGTQFGILLYGYKQLSDAEKERIKSDPFEALNGLYIKTNQLIEEKPELRDIAKEEFAKLERGDAENRRIWEWLVGASMKKLEENAKRLGLLPFEENRGESAYENDLAGIVELAIKKKAAERKADGAVIVDLTAEGLDEAVLIKSDGASTYLLRDLATIRYRADHWHFSHNLYVVDNRQSHHFRQVFRVAGLLGFDNVRESAHVDVGFMSLPEGPMSTRKGSVIPLEWLINDVVKRAGEVIEEKNPNLKDKGQTAEMVGLGALKYFDLSHHRSSEIIFDKEKSLSFEGNTGPYIQYAHARFSSIVRKAGADGAVAKDLSGSMDETERLFLAAILRFPDEVLRVLEGWAPNSLANYLFALAQQTNNFYHSHPVIKEEDADKRALRLALVRAVVITLRNGLSLLGIAAPEEM